MRRVLVILALTACGGGTPTLSQVQTQVFTPTCAGFSSCHQGASGAGGLDLESGKSFGQLINQPAVGVMGKIRVKPGDPDGSYLMEKLTKAMPAAGVQMPNGGDPLEPALIEMVRSWIAAGAPNN
jgi:hypothetical protein